MSFREIAWRTVQLARSRLERSDLSTGNPLSTASAAARCTLPALSIPWKIFYFDTVFDWQGEQIFWQGHAMSGEATLRRSNTIDYRKTKQFGDPKQVWELNRHQFLANWAAEEPLIAGEYTNAVCHLLLQWIEDNPYGYGINWCSSLELGFRLMSWEKALSSCLAVMDLEIVKIIHASVAQHCAHLQSFPSLYSSANNHRIGELAGEMAAAAMFPADKALAAAAGRAWKGIQAESRLQVTSDGVGREQAFFYHAYTMIFLKNAAYYAGKLNLSGSSDIEDLTQKMQQFLCSVTDESDTWFEIGDRDDGNLSALDLTGKFISNPALPGFYYYSEGGYAVWNNADSHILFRCGQFGYPSIAAHAHCDQLSLLLKKNGIDVLTDSGTCSYHDNEKWRRYFRGTTAHNTVCVNHRDQAYHAGPFLWSNAPRGTITEVSPEQVIGSLRWNNGIVHRRRVQYQPDVANFLTVSDTLSPHHKKSPPCCYELIWNFGPGIMLINPADSLDAMNYSFTLCRGDECLMRLHVVVSHPAQYVVHYGNEELPAGFYSRRFGQRLPITQLRITSTAVYWLATTTFIDADVSACAV